MGYLLEFQIPDFSEIEGGGKRLITEKTVRHNGIWRIHKSDPDNIFPSDPHADRVDEPEKLDLYTGAVYSSSTGQYLRTMPKKAMRLIYSELMRCKEVAITDKLKENRGAITYLPEEKPGDTEQSSGQT
ncbi:MAG TPA: hypothetical protein VGE21_06615 [Flavobacteriales bacterium]